MIPFTLAEVARAVGGRLAGGALGDQVVRGPVVADSRRAAPGALFVAVKGDRVDGHDFAADAIRGGAVAVIAARGVDGPSVLVADPLDALGRLARAVVDRLDELTVVGVTGSSGKTTTKDLLAAVLAPAGPTVAPQGSFNNELGLPLTALQCDGSTRFLVAEMGARRPGNIAYLCGLVRPRIGVVLNVGAAHAGIFGGPEVTAATKGELVEALPPDGVAVLNADDPAVSAMADRTRARVVTVGASARADVRAVDVSTDAQARPSFVLRCAQASVPVSLRLVGAHHVGNALAAAAVGLEAGLAPEAVAGALSAAEPASRWRMEVDERADGVRVVNDAYNANPDSVRAALKALAAMSGGRRAWAVLGEMLELGEEAVARHREAGRLAAELAVAGVVAVGEGARGVVEGALAAGLDPGDPADLAAAGAWAVPDRDAALSLLVARLAPGDVVLVKASRSVGLDVLAEALLARGGDGEPRPVHAASFVTVQKAPPGGSADGEAVQSGQDVGHHGGGREHG